MATMLNGTMSAAKSVMDSAREGTEHVLDSAKHTAQHARDSAEHATSSTRSALLEGLHTLNGVVRTLRSLDGDDALGWIGLARRRGSFETMAVFGAGVLMGAGVGLLLAPMSGADTRRKILGLFQGVRDTVDDTKPAADTKPADTKPPAAPARPHGNNRPTHHPS